MKWIKNLVNKSPVSPLRLAAYGFDNRTRETLRMAFDGPGKRCGVLVGEDAADAAIINMDSVNARQMWESYRARYPGQPAIVMAIKDPVLNDAIYVPKPVRIDALINAVSEIRRRQMDTAVEYAEEEVASVSSSPAGLDVDRRARNRHVANAEQPAVAPAPAVTQSPVNNKTQRPANVVESAKPRVAANEADVAKPGTKRPVAQSASPSAKPAQAKGGAAAAKAPQDLFYDPQEYLQGQIHVALNMAKRLGSAVQLRVLTVDEEWRDIIIWPEAKKVMTSLTDEQLKQLCSTPLYLINYSMRKRREEDYMEVSASLKDKCEIVPLKSFLWKVSLWTSLGRLPIGVDLKAPVSLRHWPNFTRLHVIPNAMRIATLLIDRPRPLPLVVKVLDIPQSHVFAFFSAAKATGLIDDGEVDALEAQSEPPLPQKHRHHTLFGRILKRLRGE